VSPPPFAASLIFVSYALPPLPKPSRFEPLLIDCSSPIPPFSIFLPSNSNSLLSSDLREFFFFPYLIYLFFPPLPRTFNRSAFHAMICFFSSPPCLAPLQVRPSSLSKGLPSPPSVDKGRMRQTEFPKQFPPLILPSRVIVSIPPFPFFFFSLKCFPSLLRRYQVPLLLE